jgi:hypothetical protein
LGVVVLLLLAVIWATVLIPPIVKARAENRPAGSIVDFRRRLRVLAHATPQSPASASPHPRGPVPPGRAPRPFALAPRPALSRQRRSIKRRRDILVGLVVAMTGSLVLGFLPPLRVLWAVHALLDVLFIAYVATLIYLRNLAVEREMKLRFLPTPAAAEPALLLRRSAN